MITNAPLRNGVDIKTWGLCKVDTICNGGTWSEDPLNYATSTQLTDLAASKKKVIYSICMARTAAQEASEIQRYLTFGVDVIAVRFGNEESQDISLSGITQGQSYAHGFTEGQAYMVRTAPYAALLTLPKIYSGEFPSNQQGARFSTFRKGWNDAIVSLAQPEDKIDMHVYQRMDKPEIDLSYFDEIVAWVNPIVVIESGVNTATINSSVNFEVESIKVWQKIIAKMRPQDEMGFQLLENPTSPVGLVFNGSLTGLGIWVNSIILSVPTIRVIRIPYLFPAWISGVYLYGVYDLSDGRINVFKKFFKSEAPTIGEEWIE